MKKIITFSLALIMLLTTLAACATEKKTEKPNQDGDKNTVEKQWTKKEYDFDGYVFTIVSRANTKNVIGFNGSDIDAEELTGNEVLDEVYNRNRLIETTYNCVIEQNDADGSAAAIKTLLMAGSEDDCTLIATSFEHTTSLIKENLLIELQDEGLVNLNLKQPWYDQNIQRDLAINGKIYAVAGDMLFSDENSLWVTLFNKGLVERYMPDINLYDAVLEGKWTYDLMTSYAALATVEVVADDKMNEHDQFGILAEPSIACLMGPSGQRYMEVTEDGGLKNNIFTPEFNSLFNKCVAIMDKSHTLLSTDISSGYADYWNEAYNPMFKEGRAMFMLTSMYRCLMFREMETDFGILPLPNAEEGKPYFSWMTRHTGVVAIPYTCVDLERTSALMEAMFEESSYALAPAYKENAIKYKSTRDNESIEMLDIIFSNIIYDVGYMYNLAGIHSTITDLVKQRKPGQLASQLKKQEAAVGKEMSELLNLFGYQQ